MVIRSEKQDNSFNAVERKILLTSDKSEITLIDDESEIILPTGEMVLSAVEK